MRNGLRMRHFFFGLAVAGALSGGSRALAWPVAPRSLPLGWDISHPAFIPAYDTCGHSARYDNTRQGRRSPSRGRRPFG